MRLKRSADSRVLRDPNAFFQDRRMMLDYQNQRLVHGISKSISAEKNRLVGLAASLDAMSPLKVLMRGYAIASKESGKSIKSINELSAGDRLELSLSDGTAHCTVDSIQKK